MNEINTFDYVVIGAGTGGCVVASRLAEDPSVRVALIEAGPDQHASLHSYSRDRRRGDLDAEAELAVHRRHRSRSSTTDASRCRADTWSAVPARSTAWSISAASRGISTTGRRPAIPGWSYPEVMPYFLRSENNEALPGSPYHAQGGPMNVKFVPRPNPMSPTFLKAMESLGYRANADFNGPDPEGFGSTAGHDSQRPPRFDGDCVSPNNGAQARQPHAAHEHACRACADRERPGDRR